MVRLAAHRRRRLLGLLLIACLVAVPAAAIPLAGELGAHEAPAVTPRSSAPPAPYAAYLPSDGGRLRAGWPDGTIEITPPPAPAAAPVVAPTPPRDVAIGSLLGVDASSVDGAQVAAAVARITPVAIAHGNQAVPVDAETLMAALERLGLVDAAGAVDHERLALLEVATQFRLGPLLVARGVDVGRTVGVGMLRAAIDEPLTSAAVERLREQLRAELAPLAAAARSDADPTTADGLVAMLEDLGVMWQPLLDPADVVEGRRQAALRLAAREAVPVPDETAPVPAIPDDGWTSVAGTVERRTLTLPGPVVAHVVRWRLDDPAFGLRVDWAHGAGGHRASVADAAAAQGALVAVNGGFWIDTDDPDGLLVRDGVMLSDTTAGAWWTRNIRSGFGVTDAGRWVVGVPEWSATVTLGDVREPVRGVNRRALFPGEVLLLTDAREPAPGDADVGRWYRVPLPGRLDRTTEVALPVLEEARSPLAVEPDTMVVYLDQQAAARVPGRIDTITLELRTAGPWTGLDQALGAGPWLLRDGVPTDVDQWRSEGFAASHTDARHPRSAIGFTPAGEAMIVVVDGRQPGYSRGMTQRETAALLLRLGATDAVMFDGGGSSQLVVGGSVVNRPCCDATDRPIATVVTVVPR